MSQILKSFMGLFLIMMMITASAGILGVYLTTITAQNLHASIISNIEDSNFNRKVVQECFEVAMDNGYILELVVYDSDNGISTCRDILSYPFDTDTIKTAEVKLWFEIRAGEIKLGDRHMLSGYAR